MNVSFSISTPTTTPSQVTDPNQSQPTGSTNKTLTVSITSGTENIHGTSPQAITLNFPLIGPEDIALNEVLQQLKNLDLNALKGMTTTAAVLLLNQQVGDIAASMIKGGKSFIQENAASLTQMFTGIEEQAKKAETQLFDMINSSTYPDFAEFLGKMLIAAQELRQLAGEAKHHLVMAQYDNVLDQAKQMQIAAEKNYASTIKEIEAARAEAIGSIISGALSIASTIGGGAYGAKSGAGLMGAQLGSGVGQAFGQIVSGGAGLASAKMKEDAAVLKLEADLAGVTQKKFEATQKLLQEAESITEELANIAKSLSDMVLKLYQDFLSSQNQILQRANI
ncbi:hypothetical protein GCM10023213_47730 [Prosthecobacter algae]|uniref:Uncharacterized protein n=1 Tax=Prosthecobacter algae TaxID=1144682 RepID=A0ABP9PNX9_9BACT